MKQPWIPIAGFGLVAVAALACGDESASEPQSPARTQSAEPAVGSSVENPGREAPRAAPSPPSETEHSVEEEQNQATEEGAASERAMAATEVTDSTATVHAEPEERLRFGVVYRLAAALGTPEPHIHGHPTGLGGGRHVAVVSFAEGEELGELHAQLWLIYQAADGTTRRVASTRIPHAPVNYEMVSAGEAREQADELFRVQAVRGGDFDNDGRPEFEMVVDVDDEVVCGPGLLTHRWFMVYNADDALTLAADIPLVESTYRGARDRGHVSWVDQNHDGHPDLDLRAKSCTDGSYDEDDTCRAEETVHTYYYWNASSDSWTPQSGGTSPCPGAG